MTFHGIKIILAIGKLFKYAESLYIVQKLYRGVVMNEYMSYEEYLEKVKTGILTEDGNCPVTPLLRPLAL